ncbi:hypothetical protein AB2B41_03700 [Marimonas sp. MJW-29]|uniref:Uncharacterized protein n=1 Tax=Sulfitobacter sediminis TaxID=3234186 RepID=A0ABV3RJ86_9RHOB
MSNVVAFPRRAAPDRQQNIAALLENVCLNRRSPDDVFWLKENAELLNLLVSINEPVAPAALSPFEGFYEGLEERLRFYPQYYRFFLSICLDLEDLGLRGEKGKSLCLWAAASGLAGAELSDLQRAEARRLLSRRGEAEPVSAGALGERLRRFVERSQTFAIPNKKAAYELTHIVYYLSEYGRTDPGLSEAALTSLEFTGILAFIDQNYDLLAEICTAIDFAGGTPSPIWRKAVADAHVAIRPEAAERGPAAHDAYHTYLVTGWSQAVSGGGCFDAEITPGPFRFVDDTRSSGVLRALSECL